MNSFLQSIETGHLAKSFRWRDQHGGHHEISNMETRHLFFTVRMIWNHSCPPDGQIHPFKRYRFGPTYTPEYLGIAVRKMLSELSTRELEPRWEEQLIFMENYLRERAKKITDKPDQLPTK